jgi:hypothetical protein
VSLQVSRKARRHGSAVSLQVSPKARRHGSAVSLQVSRKARRHGSAVSLKPVGTRQCRVLSFIVSINQMRFFINKKMIEGRTYF